MIQQTNSNKQLTSRKVISNLQVGLLDQRSFFTYLIDFEFKPNREVFLCKLESLNIDLEVKDSENIPRRLQIVNSAVGIETLGVYIAYDRSSII